MMANGGRYGHRHRHRASPLVLLSFPLLLLCFLLQPLLCAGYYSDTEEDRVWAANQFRRQQATLRVLGRLPHLPEPSLRVPSEACDATATMGARDTAHVASVPRRAATVNPTAPPHRLSSPLGATAAAMEKASAALNEMPAAQRWSVLRRRLEHAEIHARAHPVSSNGLLVSLDKKHGLVFCKGCPDPHVDGSNIGKIWESHWIPEDYDVDGEMVYAVPNDGSIPPYNAEELRGNVAFVERGGVRFVTKALHVQRAGAVALVIVDNGQCERGSDFECSPLGSRATGGWARREPWEDWVDVYIPVVMLMPRQGDRLRGMMEIDHVELREFGLQYTPRMKRLNAKQLAHADEAFDIMDEGGDGTVSRAEVRRLLHEQLTHTVHTEHKRAMATRAADDMRSSLTHEDLHAAVAAHVDTHATKLHSADHNSDGVLTRREFVHHLTESGVAGPEFAERLVAAERARMERDKHAAALQEVGALSGARVKRVQVWTNMKANRVGRIRFRFDDASTADFGAGGSDQSERSNDIQQPSFELDLDAGEVIVKVEVSGRRHLAGIIFLTSENRSSPTYGDLSGGKTTILATMQEGGMIVGLQRNNDRSYAKIVALHEQGGDLW